MRYLIAFLIVAGCTPEPATAPDASHAGDAAAPDAPTPDGPTTHPDGATPASIYPLAVGDSWQHLWMSSGGGTTPVSCDETRTITGTTTIDGRDAFVEDYTRACPGGTSTVTNYHAPLGDRVETRLGGGTPPIWYVLDPPSEGHSWASNPDGTGICTWHFTGAATVPAGTFDDCWTATCLEGGDSRFTYCRGVGPISTDGTYAGGYTVTARLTAKSF